MGFVRLHGLSSAAEHIIERVQKSNYPLTYPYRFIRLLLRLKEFGVAGRMIKALDDLGKSHPLIDQEKGVYLWGIGKREEAIEFSIKSAHRWAAPYIYYQASKFLATIGNQGESERYFEIARYLAKKDEESRDWRLKSN